MIREKYTVSGSKFKGEAMSSPRLQPPYRLLRVVEAALTASYMVIDGTNLILLIFCMFIYLCVCRQTSTHDPGGKHQNS